MRIRLLAIVGPTAIGKSALAVHLAQRFTGEIVSADSRQIYRCMDVGTAKPSTEDRSAVPHHLIDIVAPDEEYSLALFMEQANRAIEDIHARAKLPLLVGGSGQYVWGLLEGWQVPAVPPDPELRRHLEQRARDEGAEALYAELQRLDPAGASRVDRRNARRVIRALEVRHARQGEMPATPGKLPPPFDARIIGMTMPRPELYRRIDERVDRMVEAGWVGEVRNLLEQGYGPELPSMSSFGYGELVSYLNGEIALDDTIQRIKSSTHRFARSQYTWFKPNDPRIQWFDVSEGYGAVETEVARWLEEPR